MQMRKTVEICLSNLYTLLKADCDSNRLSRHYDMFRYFLTSNAITHRAKLKIEYWNGEVVRTYE